MRVRDGLKRLRSDERGAIALFVALGMTMFLAAAAIGVDMGHVMNVRTESQRVADLAALAGASGFIDANGASRQQTIQQRAIGYAAQNMVNRAPVTLVVSDVQIDPANERVRVTVRHTAAAGNAIQTVFARMIGVANVDIVTTAVAEAFPATGVNCILPFMLPDNHRDGGGDPEVYDHPDDYYEPPTHSPPSATATGYTAADIGTQVVIKPGNKSKSLQPNSSWYYPVVLTGRGASSYQAAIEACPDPTLILSVGDTLTVEPGAMIGPTRKGIENLVAQAPNHAWSTANNCVVDLGSGDATACVGSPRLRAVPMMAPPDAPKNGRKGAEIVNWAGVFIEGMNGNDVLARFAGYSGFAAAGGGGGSGSINKMIRLVE